MSSPKRPQWSVVEFVDLGAQQARIRDRIEQRIRRVLDHGQYIMGPEVRELEEALASFVGVKHAICCSSGTDALLMLLMALGMGAGHAVLTTPFTFVATAEAVALVGATPLFVDIDPETFNLCPRRLSQALEALEDWDPRIHPLPRVTGSSRPVPRAVIAVDLFGVPADYDAICEVASKYGLWVIEDAAQSLGAQRNGIRAGALAPYATTSFFPAKPLGAYGDGGMCFTRDEVLAEALRSLRLHGVGRDRYEHVRVGLNGRLDTLQAAILLAKLEIFSEELELRQEVANRYQEILTQCPGIRLPVVPEGCRSAWAEFSVLAQDESHRGRIQARLREAGIPSAVYYPKPLHLQPAFRSLGYQEGDFPSSEEVARRILSLPMHPYLGQEVQEKIAQLIWDALQA